MDWKAYKQAAALPFEVLDCQVAVEKTVEGAHGDHRIDVWLQANQYGVKTRWLIDCRHWNTPISKDDVFALKQVLKDVRADRALMLSNAGFDSGATKAARSTSITLTTLEALQETAELELTRTTLISLENRITKLKQALERLSESIQVGPGLWQSRPKAGVDGDWVTKTTAALEAIRFGFAKARLQQPPYFVRQDEATGQRVLAETIAEFVAQALVLIQTAEQELRSQQTDATQAAIRQSELLHQDNQGNPAAAETDAVQSQDSEEKPKRSLHAAFFRRKVSSPPPPQPADERSQGRGGDRSARGGGKPGYSSQSRSNSYRPGPTEPGPSRARPNNGTGRGAPRDGDRNRPGKAGAHRGQSSQYKGSNTGSSTGSNSSSNPRQNSSSNPSSNAGSSAASGTGSRNPRPAPGRPRPDRNSDRPRPNEAHRRPRPGAPSAASAGSKPRLKRSSSQSPAFIPRPQGGRPAPRRADGGGAPRLRSGEARNERFSSPAQPAEPTMEGRWWDQPESRPAPRSLSRPGPGARSDRPRSPRPAPRLADGKKRLGGKSFGAKPFGAKPFGAKKFDAATSGAKPLLRNAASGKTDRPRFQGASDRPRASGKFLGKLAPKSARGGAYGDRKFGDRKFGGGKFGGGKFSGGKPGRAKFDGSGYKGGKSQSQRPDAPGRAAAAKPLLRKQSGASGESSPKHQGDGESS